jgi:outer membrane protein OmpA-like peptidoglycan-associated protein
MFRNDPSIDCCTVISPDMAGLTGGLDKKGNGAEGTSKGAHVVVSTSTMSRSIADTYLVRSDYFQSNRTDVEKFVAGYLKGCEELIANKKAYDDGKGQSPAYLATLKMAQQIYGEKVLPSIEVDAHGLICDAIFVGLAGNVSFFTDPGNLNGFDAKQKRALDVVTNLGFCKDRFGFQPAGWDYQQLATTAGIAYTAPKANQPKIKAEGIDAFPDSLDDRTILSFTISFQPNQKEFSLDTYSSDFRRVLQTASTFGNAAILIRGHADPTRTLLDFLQAGQKKGDIERRGVKGSFEYFFRGAPLDLNATAGIMKYIQDGEYNGVEPNPQLTMQVAQSLSLDRAEAVRKAIVEFAKINKINFDASQIKPDGVGIKEPLVAKPKNETDARRNMRVEFRMIKVAPESLNQSDFEF